MWLSHTWQMMTLPQPVLEMIQHYCGIFPVLKLLSSKVDFTECRRWFIAERCSVKVDIDFLQQNSTWLNLHNIRCITIAKNVLSLDTRLLPRSLCILKMDDRMENFDIRASDSEDGDWPENLHSIDLKKLQCEPRVWPKKLLHLKILVCPTAVCIPFGLQTLHINSFETVLNLVQAYPKKIILQCS